MLTSHTWSDCALLLLKTYPYLTNKGCFFLLFMFLETCRNFLLALHA